MVLKLLLFLGTAWLLLLGGHYLLYLAAVRYFSITSSSLKIVLFSSLTFLSLSFIGSFFLVHWKPGWFTAYFYTAAGAWTGLFVNLLLAAAIAWLLIGLLRLTGLDPNTRLIAVLLTAGAVGFTGYGIFNAFQPRVNKVELELQSLTAQRKEKSIVQLSDVHLGHVHGVGFLRNVVQQVNSLDPDLVVITGDLFDGMGGRYKDFIPLLNRLRAKKGIFFVTGNHETYVGLGSALGTLEETSIRPLQNEMVEIDGLEIVGISYPGLDPSRDERFIQHLKDTHSPHRPRVLLFHTPTNLALPDGDNPRRHAGTYWFPDTTLKLNREIGADLQLSGHTHRGQVFPFGYLTRLIYRGCDYGLHHAGDLALYTTSGVGTWGPPVRTENSSEILHVTLR
jgi:hypothetical protein